MNARLLAGFATLVLVVVGMLGAAGPAAAADPTVPDAPRNVQLDGLGVHSILVSYEPPGSDGGSPIISYTATAIDVTNPANGGQTATGTAMPLEVPGLTYGDAYEFIVTATNAVGTGPAGGPTGLAIAEPIAPDPPTDVTAVAHAGSATVSFTPTPPSADGGAPIVSYTVASWYIDNHMVLDGPGATGTSSPITVTGLTNGVSYTFHVTAFNGSQTSDPSPWTSEVTPRDVPGAPTDVTATAGHEAATVTFTAPVDDGGSPVTRYTVTATDVTDSANGGQRVTRTAGPIVVDGLTAGDTYTFTVAATNAIGTGPASAASASIIPLGVHAPAAPTGVTVPAAGDGIAVVIWTAPVDDGGSPITGYTVTATDTTDPANGGQHAPAPGTDTGVNVGGLTVGDTYVFTVVASNAAHDSAPSAPSSPVLIATQPGVPTGVTAVAGDGEAVISFDAPASDGFAPITGYGVVATDVTNPANGDQQVIDTASPITVTGLTNGDTYTFVVVAINGAGLYSQPSPDTAPIVVGAPVVTVPGAPSDVSAVAGDGSATVSFTAPSDDGGSRVTGYTVAAHDTTNPASPDVVATGTSSPITVSGLINGDTYLFTVVASNSVGSGASSGSSGPVTPVAPAPPVTVPGAPSDVSVVAGDGSAVVSFTAPSDDGGSPITGYTVTAHDTTNPGVADVQVTGTSSPITVTGLVNGDTYLFTVVASNSVGSSVASGSSGPVTPVAPAPPVTVPGAPSDVSVVAGDGSAVVSFTAPTDDGSSPVTGYTVTAHDTTNAASPDVVVTGTSSPITVTGLTNGDTYIFTVVASNSAGSGVASGSSGPVTPVAPAPPVTVPGAPSGVSVVPGDASAVVSFTAPSDDGGSLITGFTVTAHDTTNPGNADVQATGSSSPITVSGLINGDTYMFTVVATNSAGSGASSGSSAPVVPTTPVVPPPPLTPDAAFVTAVYDDFLGRMPTADELACAVAALEAGAPRATVIARVLATRSWADRVVTELYLAILGRQPDAGGLNYWSTLLATGKSDIRSVAGQILESDECVRAAGSTGQWIRTVYRVLLHRSPDPSGLAYWRAVAATKGRAAAVSGIQRSEEARDDAVGELYGTLLHRAPDPAGLEYWAHRLLTGGVEAVALRIAESPEFFQEAQVLDG